MKFADPVAERSLAIMLDGSQLPVQVKIRCPVKVGDDWKCTYEILIGGKRSVHTTRGVDSMQALQLAIPTLDAELKAKARALRESLTFLGESVSSLLEGGGFRR